jgi:hypothetical protein
MPVHAITYSLACDSCKKEANVPNAEGWITVGVQTHGKVAKSMQYAFCSDPCFFSWGDRLGKYRTPGWGEWRTV